MRIKQNKCIERPGGSRQQELFEAIVQVQIKRPNYIRISLILNI
jgi:hypothetical protein